MALLPFADELHAQQCYHTKDQKVLLWDCAKQSCYTATTSGNAAATLLLWHKRMGHRNIGDVCVQLGLKLPAKMPLCPTCLEAKSKRHPLTSRAWPIHDAPRAAYAWAWDHAGPYRTRTWGGHNICSLKVDIYSGKLVPTMVSSTANCHSEWALHVRRLEAKHGRQVVSRMITDRAPYFQSAAMEAVNDSNGIVHVTTQAYTQELNPAERPLQTMNAMARANMIHSCAPAGAYGECIIASAQVLNACSAVAGGRLSRNEKYEGRLLPS